MANDSMLDFLKEEGISDRIINEIKSFRNFYKLENPELEERVPVPQYKYYGKEVWEEAITAILAGENILLDGPKATGKNVLAQGLSNVFHRPEWDISFYINTDSASLIGTDTFENGKVTLRKGPIYQVAENGGFGVLDEINMAKNESLAVLHATLDFRKFIDVPGYDRIRLQECTRFIGTMNYGYAGTREVNEALASRFVVIHMPIITKEGLLKLISDKFPTLKDTYQEQFADLFMEIRKKCESGEISTKALDLRGLLASIHMMDCGLEPVRALELGMVNKCFDDYERQLVDDMVSVRLPGDLTRDQIFTE